MKIDASLVRMCSILRKYIAKVGERRSPTPGYCERRTARGNDTQFPATLPPSPAQMNQFLCLITRYDRLAFDEELIFGLHHGGNPINGYLIIIITSHSILDRASNESTHLVPVTVTR